VEKPSEFPLVAQPIRPNVSRPPPKLVEQGPHPVQSQIGRPILDVSFGRKRPRQGWDNGILRQLLVVDLETGMMMMVMVMAVMYYHHNLRLRRIG